ncbi:hypothetical protein JCM19231_1255 [Vibrio ishigakensis]|uniref:LuxQ periplasmic domain-containing protein n=1 Tax=Vibrio ishigakensis TaxID=1481914 RepID=A0A0B8NS72_9VIBR|nr:hypothetical protein JCM19231_1255 [Vibrio ishigakensis]
MFFVYNYQLNSTTFESEQERNFDQTSQIVKQLMENYLNSVQVSQDITSRSRTLIESFQNEDYQGIESFMQEVEEFDPSNTPDIRFLYQYGKIAWKMGAMNSSVFRPSSFYSWPTKSISTTNGTS